MIGARHRTPAVLAAVRSRREDGAPDWPQAEARDRRRAGHLVRLRDGWSLLAEVAALVDPLAARIAVTPNPTGFRDAVEDVVDAVHGVVSEVAALLARADAERRSGGVPFEDRGRSVRLLVDLAPRPPLPTVTDTAVTRGAWAATLADLARPYDAALAGLLGRAATSVVSDRVLAALRELDHAVIAATRLLDRADAARAERAAAPPPPDATEAAVAELAALGVEVPAAVVTR